jgi:sugar lactone lactonase YvrE
MPTGVAVADDGRIFVCYPRWGDDVPFTVAELRDGREVPYPDATINEFDDNNPAGTLAVAAGRHVYFTNNQLHLQDQYQGGEDLRTPPYSLMRVAIDAGPVR